MEPKRSPQEDDERLKKLMADIGYPNNNTIYQAFKQIIMETRLQYEDAWPEPKVSVSSAIDRYELAVMAYMRLGKLTKDDEKTRQIRIDTLRDYVAARIALSQAMQRPIDAEELILEERKRASKVARYHTHHAMWVGLPVVLT